MIKKKRATSLAEVMIILAIISTTVVASTTLVVKSLATIKNNEIEDTANGVMIKALEIAKSPADVYVSDTSFVNAASGQVYFFSIQNQNNQYTLRRESGTASTCDSQGPFKTNLFTQTTTQNINICLVIEITPQTTLNQRIYEIAAKVVYQLEGETIINSVTGYRKDDFVLR